MPLMTPKQAAGMHFFRRRYNLKRTRRFGIRRLRKRSPGLENIFDMSSGCICVFKKADRVYFLCKFPCMIYWLKSSFMDCHFKGNFFTHEKLYFQACLFPCSICKRWKVKCENPDIFIFYLLIEEWKISRNVDNVDKESVDKSLTAKICINHFFC